MATVNPMQAFQIHLTERFTSFAMEIFQEVAHIVKGYQEENDCLRSFLQNELNTRWTPANIDHFKSAVSKQPAELNIPEEMKAEPSPKRSKLEHTQLPPACVSEDNKTGILQPFTNTTKEEQTEVPVSSSVEASAPLASMEQTKPSAVEGSLPLPEIPTQVQPKVAQSLDNVPNEQQIEYSRILPMEQESETGNGLRTDFLKRDPEEQDTTALQALTFSDFYTAKDFAYPSTSGEMTNQDLLLQERPKISPRKRPDVEMPLLFSKDDDVEQRPDVEMPLLFSKDDDVEQRPDVEMPRLFSKDDDVEQRSDVEMPRLFSKDDDVEQRPDVEMPLQPSKDENVEQCVMERLDLITLSKTEPGPVLEPLTSFEKQTDVEMSSRSSEVEGVQQCMIEGSNSSMTLSQSEPSLTLMPQTRSKMDCCKYFLETTTLSASDKCVLCLGPISSLTSTGYRCKVCSRAWHLSCYRRKKVGDEIFDYDDSATESASDSESDSDSSMILEPRLNTNVSDEAGTSKCLPLPGKLAEVTTGETSDSKVSNKDSSNKCVKNTDKETPLCLTNRNYCFVCGKPQSRLTRHLKIHMTHPEVSYAFNLPVSSQERKTLFIKMRNKGNFQHNSSILRGERGQLKVKRRPKATTLAETFIHCMHCQGLYVRKEMWRHVQRCIFKPESQNLDGQAQKTLLSQQQFSSGMWKILSSMNKDEIGLAVRNDLSIVQLAQSLDNKHGQDSTKHEHIRQKLREVARLLICLRADFSINSMEEAIKPSNFLTVVQAVKKVAGFNKKSLSFEKPSLALRLGQTLKSICNNSHSRALKSDNDALLKSTETFMKLYQSQWRELFFNKALHTLSPAKYNKPVTLPFTEDVQILHKYLQKTAHRAVSNLMKEANTKNYAELAKATLAQIIAFNRRRAREVSNMLTKSFVERDRSQLHKDVAMGLSRLELRLCNYFTIVELGKRQRKVGFFLAPSMVDALSLLSSKRKECGVPDDNVFLFGRPKNMTHYKGDNCLRVHARLCGAKQPEFLGLPHLRKHVATLSQILHLKKKELEQVADFVGHDIRVHQDFYRLPLSTTQLAKIAKLLLSIEKGDLSGMQGKSLDEIEIEESLSLSETEDNDNDSQAISKEVRGPLPEHGGDLDPASVCTILQHGQDSGNQGKGIARRKRDPRRQPKKMWTKAEVAAVMQHFGCHIKKGKLASKYECSQCKQAEDSVLAQRTVQNIRDFVRNRITTIRKHKAQKKP